MENPTNQETQQSNLILTDNAVEISVEVREQITKKIAAWLKKATEEAGR